MKPAERTYCVGRARAIFNERQNALKEKHAKTKTEVTDKDKIQQIIDWDATIKPRGWTLKTPIGECFTYNSTTTISLDQKAYNNDLKILRKEYNQITDRIMLTNCEDAIKLLEKFEKE